MADKALIDKLKKQIQDVKASSERTMSRESLEWEFLSNEPLAEDHNCDIESGLRGVEKAFGKIVALVNISDRSEQSIRSRLERSGFNGMQIDSAVDRAKACGFIDDMRFAAVLIRSRLSQGKGIPGIGRELRTHGIDIDTVPGWPEEFVVEDTSELERALELLNRHPPRSKNMRDGAYRKLVNKGFSSGVSASAARIWIDSLK